MDITILGSGGNSPTPKPTCSCKICSEAREEGIPYERNGNSIFIHDENILIDTPEMIWKSLNRENIESVDYVLLTHFHADHWMGLRVLQALASEEPPVERFIGEDKPLLLMNRDTYENAVKQNSFLKMLTDSWANIEILEDGESREIGSINLENIESSMDSKDENKVSNFLFTKNGKRVLISSDENTYLDTSIIPELDLWIKETGYFKQDPDGNPLVTDKAVENSLKNENTFENSVKQVEKVNPEKVVMTEIEELFRRSYDDYKKLERKHEDLNLSFAYDGMKLDI